METFKEIWAEYGPVVLAYLAANLGAIILFILKTLFGSTTTKKFMSNQVKQIEELKESMLEIESNVEKYAKEVTDATKKKQDEILESKSTNLEESTKEKQDEISIDDVLKL